MASAELELIKRLGKLRGALGEARAKQLFDEVPKAGKWYSSNALERSLSSDRAVLSPIHPLDFTEITPEIEWIDNANDTVDKLYNISKRPSFKGWNHTPQLWMDLKNPIVADIIDHNGRHRNYATNSKDMGLTELLSWSAEENILRTGKKKLSYDDAITSLLEEFQNKRKFLTQDDVMQRPSQRVLPFSKYFKPFWRGGRV